MLSISNLTKILHVQTKLTQTNGQRNLFYWLYVVFNAVDQRRIEAVGPDQACAEWLIRNGGGVRWCGENEITKNYNRTPVEGKKYCIEEIDATEASLTHHGFPHLNGCRHVTKIKLTKCKYLEDRALTFLPLVGDTLRHLEVSDCARITDNGLKELMRLSNLTTLVLKDLPAVEAKDDVAKLLKSSLNKCQVKFE